MRSWRDLGEILVTSWQDLDEILARSCLNFGVILARVRQNLGGNLANPFSDLCLAFLLFLPFKQSFARVVTTCEPGSRLALFHLTSKLFFFFLSRLKEFIIQVCLPTPNMTLLRNR